MTTLPFTQVKIAFLLILCVCHIKGLFSTRQFFTGGRCSQIAGVGYPVLMVAHAHKYIMDATNVKNPYTDLAMLYSESSADATTEATTYKYVFGLTTNFKFLYIAIKFTTSGDGIGSMKLQTYLKTENINTVGTILGIPDVDTALQNEIECGDLKLMLSFYGQDSTPNLPYTFPGRNSNSVRLNLLNRLNVENKNSRDTLRVCHDDFYGAVNIFRRPLPLVPDPLPDTATCVPEGLNVSYIHVECRDAGPRQGIGIMEIGLNDGTGVYNNVVVHNGTPNGGGAVETLFLADGDTLNFEFETRDYARIQLYKDGTLVSEVECGEIDNSTQKSSIKTKDLLGFSNVRGGRIIRRIRGLEYIG